ncbi:MAG: hypothetical protein GC137_07220 [Alphaproteobacteria bacterium]|nr:hypothetical protein [Alphaproteobacteria bacterium]
MSNIIEQAIEAIYSSLDGEHEELDERIEELKAALKEVGEKEAKFETSRLAQGNREGRKRMQSYFKKRGVIVKFV